MFVIFLYLCYLILIKLFNDIIKGKEKRRNCVVTVIAALNSKYIHSSLAPYYLLSAIKDNCQGDAFVVEGTINENPQAVADRIIGLKPDVIGFSCYIWNIVQTKGLIEIIKDRLKNSIIVLGGPEVSYNAYNVIEENPLADFVISGEGEKPFAQLISALANKSSFQAIPGLCYTENDKIIACEPYTSKEQPPSPYSKDYFDNLQGRIAYFESSRGCPYSCAYCLSGRCGNVRYFDLNQAKDEIIKLGNSGTKTVKFVDRTFNSNRARAIDIFKFLIENYSTKIPNDVCFHFEIAGDILDDETIDLLKTAPAGFIQLEIGLQSFNEKTLEYINRKTNTKILTKNISRLLKAGNIHVHIDLIAGLPFEDFTSFKNSFNKAYSLKPHMLQLGFLKLIHGSPMRENPDLYPCSFSKLPPYEVTETKWLSRDMLKALHLAEDALDRLYNSNRFKRTLNYLINQVGLDPFDLFLEFGEFCSKDKALRISLDDYTTLLFEYFSNKPLVDKMKLRDLMVCDRLSTDSSGRIPKILQVKDKKLREFKIYLDKTSPKKGVKRGVAVLYSKPTAVYVEYENKNPVTGEYKLFTVNR